eukprot:1869244-Pleurochrysis_carterae.AAC.1
MDVKYLWALALGVSFYFQSEYAVFILLRSTMLPRSSQGRVEASFGRLLAKLVLQREQRIYMRRTIGYVPNNFWGTFRPSIAELLDMHDPGTDKEASRFVVRACVEHFHMHPHDFLYGVVRWKAR